MESRLTARDCSSRAVRNRLLPHRLVALRRCPFPARRIFPDSRAVAGSTIASTHRRNEPTARNHSSAVAALCGRRPISSPYFGGHRPAATELSYNPNAPGNLVILNWNRVYFLRLVRLVTRGRRNESTSPAQSEAYQNDRNFQGQRHESASVLPLLQSFCQSPQVSKAINSSAVSVGPARLQRITAYEIETGESKTLLRISYLRSRDITKHVGFATARRAGTCASQHLKSEK